jgi:all-trans-retinol 13,14-reductase
MKNARKHERLSDATPRDGWDTIIIGSGPGGLTTAALLAKAGQKVLVLERHYEPGGFSHTFKRKDYFFDVGVHYIGAVQHPKSVESRIFRDLTGGRLEWEPMGDPYDVALIDGERYDFAPSIKKQIAMLSDRFPDEDEAIRKYFDLIREAASGAGSFFAERAIPPIASAVAGRFMRRKFEKFAQRTTYEVLRELTDNEDLITVLCTPCGDYGLAPNKSSFVVHAMVIWHYRGGGNYPVGGAASIHNGMIDEIEAHGGTVLVKASVEKVTINNGRAEGVLLENGEEIRSARVVSSIGVRNTYTKLVRDDFSGRDDILADLERVKPSIGHLCLYVGLNASDETLNLPRYNYWVYDEYAGDGTPGGRIPAAYISFPSAKDPAWQQEHPDKATVQMIGLGNYDDFKPYADTKWGKRPDDYNALKATFQESMLKRLYALHPETEGHVDWAEVSTPLSTAHFSNYGQGEIYGLEHTPERFALRWLRPRTAIKNFYLSGQDIVSCGVGGALFSGVLTASAILNTNELGKIMKRTA